MIRTVAALALAPLFALALGCSGAPDSASTDATGDALTGNPASGYFFGLGGAKTGLSVHLANAKATACADGQKRTACAVHDLDLNGLKLDAKTAATVGDAFNAGHAVVQGHIDAKSQKLVVERAWMGVGTADAQSVDALYLVSFHIQNAMCLQGQDCSGPRYNQVAVNAADVSSASSIVKDVSLDGVGTASDLAKGEDAMKIGAAGLLVLGHDVTLVSNHNAQTTTTLLATRFFLPVSAY